MGHEAAARSAAQSAYVISFNVRPAAQPRQFCASNLTGEAEQVLTLAARLNKALTSLLRQYPCALETAQRRLGLHAPPPGVKCMAEATKENYEHHRYP